MTDASSVRSTGTFPTDNAPRYAKQLAAHLGRKLEIVEDGDSTVVVHPDGECRLTPTPDALVLAASARDVEGMATIKRVVGGHLERFAQRDGLLVVWTD